MYENGLYIKEYVVGQTVFYEVVSKVEFKEDIVPADKPKESNGLDHFQTGLDLAGLIPGFGEIADGVNGLIYLGRGDKTNAALSFGAMIPFLGWASTGGKFAKKGSDLYEARNVVSTEKMESIYSPIYQDLVNSPLGKTQNHLGILPNNGYQFGAPKALTFKMPPVKNDIPSIKSGDVDVEADLKNVGIEAKGKDKLSGPVEVKAPPGATDEQIAQVKAYVDGSNNALDVGALSPTGRVSTKGKLRQEASRAARLEGKRAADNGDSYKGHVGHVPDTTWIGSPNPHSWLDLDPKVNLSIGGQANKYPIGYKPTEFKFVKEDLKDD